MSLHEIADVLYRHGELEAYKALMDHIKALAPPDPRDKHFQDCPIRQD